MHPLGTERSEPLTISADHFGDFAISLEFAESQPVLAVRGEVDILTAPELGASLNALIDQGQRFVTIELAECSFIDLSGLRVLARGAHRLALFGGALRIRSASAMVLRIIEITGLSDLALPVQSIEPPDAAMSDEGLASRLDAALRSTVSAAQAQGVIMERDGVAKEYAIEILPGISHTPGSLPMERPEATVTFLPDHRKAHLEHDN
jgi:anti-anti-sigma factor